MVSQNDNLCSTLLEFAAPLLGDLNSQMPYDLTKDALTFVITAWNAHAMALPAWDHPEHLAHLQELLAAPEATNLREMFARLSEARQQRFRLDARVIDTWELVDDSDGRRRLRCELRMPPLRGRSSASSIAV